jgi:C4-dicarboxylate transporter DctM subunit
MALLGIFLLFFIGLAMFCKMPVGYSIGAATLAVIFANGMKTSTLCTVAFSGLDSFPLLAVPLFIFAGAIMQHSGIAHALVNLIDSIVGRIRGSLGAVTVLASAAFGVLTGSCMATISCIGGIMVPEMKKKGYSPSYCAALAAASSFLGILIPPSVPGIMYGLCASVSISAVWLSTIGPAILCTILFITINYFKQGRKEVKDTAPITASLYFGNVGKSFLKSIPALIMPVIIFGGIYGGIFTATEAGAAAVLYGTLFYFGKKVLHLGGTDSSFMQMTVDSAISTATICILIGFSNCSGRVISMIGIAEAIKAFVTSHIASATVFLIFANILFLICGMLIDINAAILLVVPPAAAHRHGYGHRHHPLRRHHSGEPERRLHHAPLLQLRIHGAEALRRAIRGYYQGRYALRHCESGGRRSDDLHPRPLHVHPQHGCRRCGRLSSSDNA